MWGHEGEDCMINIRKAPNGCGEWDGKKANGTRMGERISQSKLGRMGMTGEWMEVRTHLGIGVKLTIGFPSGAF
jgi:hypothetical protein